MPKIVSAKMGSLRWNLNQKGGSRNSSPLCLPVPASPSCQVGTRHQLGGLLASLGSVTFSPLAHSQSLCYYLPHLFLSPLPVACGYLQQLQSLFYFQQKVDISAKKGK